LASADRRSRIEQQVPDRHLAAEIDVREDRLHLERGFDRLARRQVQQVDVGQPVSCAR
jgi:hypothetical protein